MRSRFETVPRALCTTAKRAAATRASPLLGTLSVLDIGVRCVVTVASAVSSSRSIILFEPPRETSASTSI
jgi:hypothetical protein